MRDKEITVIINTFKSEDKIYNCLNSIPQQTFIIVIENSNNTNFKKSLESKYSNVTCILAGETQAKLAFADRIGFQGFADHPYFSSVVGCNGQ